MGKKSRLKKEIKNETTWTLFLSCDPAPQSREQREKMAKGLGVTLLELEQRQKVDQLLLNGKKEKMYQNNLYTVFVSPVFPDEHRMGNIEIIRLSIRRNDREPIHDWRHLQRIKNELVGAECDGVELYPAESRVVDTANQYHLWVFKDPKLRWPIGWSSGKKLGHVEGAETKQRDF